MGKYFKDTDLQRMIDLIDKDKDGYLKYDEFIVGVFGKI